MRNPGGRFRDCHRHCCGSLILRRYITIRLENNETAIGSHVLRKRVEADWRMSVELRLKGSGVGLETWASTDASAPADRSQDDGAQEPESLLHKFLRNKDADTSGLDALGELSSTQVKVLSHQRLKNGHFKQKLTFTASSRTWCRASC